MSDRKNGARLAAFLLGGAIFAGLGLLMAPQSGKETRKKVKRFFDDVCGKAEELMDDGREKIEKITNDLK
jgi:gas vesicle protein